MKKIKQILCFGDSNTYGLIPGTDQRYGWGVRWTSILEERIREKGYRVIEEGLCGRTTVFDDPFRTERRGTEMLPAILESHRPVDTIVLMLGTNDCKSVYSATPEVIGQGIEQLLNQINTVNPDAQVLLISPILLGERIWEEGFDPEFDQKSREVSLNLHRVYKKIAEKRNISYLQASAYADPGAADQEHLDAEGHRRLADAIYEKLAG